MPSTQQKTKSSGATGDTASSQASRSVRGFFGNGPIPMSDNVSLILGSVILGCVLPVSIVIVGLTVLWDALDRCFMGKPQDGLIMRLARWINIVTAPFNAKLVRNPADAFLVNLVLMLGVGVPILFGLSLYYTMNNGFSYLYCLGYHILRLGPYFMNFAYCYTSCHKEGHSRAGLWAPAINPVMQKVFNWWIGLFYGVMPSSFAVGHSINHHKYNNGPLDIISTSDRPRDIFSNWVRYLPRFSAYALNISTIRGFIFEKNYNVAFQIFVGSMWYWTFVAVVYRLSPMFAIAYLVFPLFENILLLAVVNWVWHAFIDPDSPDNTYVGSVTLYDGPVNVMNEDYHVVHHQYPGIHWTKNPLKYKQHFDKGEYQDHAATAFQDTHVFELFFIIILRDYAEMARRFVDHSGKLATIKDKENVLKARLQSCWWGPRAKSKYIQKGWEGVEKKDATGQKHD